MAKEGKKKASTRARATAQPDGWAAPFPHPENPNQRYSGDTPWLAIVNARGPKGVWKQEKKDPSWIPLCLDLFTHPVWATWTLECQMFTHMLWRYAAKEDVNGVIWGEPESLRRQMRQVDGFQTCATIRTLCEDREKFAAFLELHAQAGLIVYLSDAEKEAAERLIFAKQHRQDRDRDRDNTETANSSGSSESLYEKSTSSQSPTGQDTTARAPGTAQATAAGSAAGQAQTSQPVQPVNPAKPEAGEVPSTKGLEGSRIDGPPCPAHGSAPGQMAASPPKQAASLITPGEPSRVGDHLHWHDPISVAFACDVHNILHHACLRPGNHDDRKHWPRDVRNNVSSWAKLHFQHVRAMPSADSFRQWVYAHAYEQVKYGKSANSLDAVLMSIVQQQLGLAPRKSRAGP
jgi:hypothetical protein